jgi:hypothetical protein
MINLKYLVPASPVHNQELNPYRSLSPVIIKVWSVLHNIVGGTATTTTKSKFAVMQLKK